MFLESLSLQNFRSHKQASFEFSPKLTVIIGANTSGKTNILEAVYLLATGRSFRAGVEREMILYEQELARVKCEVGNEKWETEVGSKIEEVEQSIKSKNQKIPPHSAEGANPTSHIPHPNSRLEILVTTGSVQGRRVPHKRYLVNGIGRRRSDFVGQFFAVLFNPQDIELVTDSPSRRRAFLDNILVQTSKSYAGAIAEYEKALRRRNKILSAQQENLNSTVLHRVVENKNRGELEYWDKLLVENGRIITKRREELISFLNKKPFAKKDKHMRATLSKEGEFGLAFKVGYNKSEIGFGRLKEYAGKEAAAGHTLIGPHRDDFVIQIRNSKFKIRNLSAYGSRGEQRMGVLWLKLGELEYLKEETGEKPILLLDDIFSELDHGHRKLVQKFIPNYQTIITAADKHYVQSLIGQENRIQLIKLEKI